MSNDVIQDKLKELEEQIKRKMLTEMRIKEGAENMRKATDDKKSLAHVNAIVKQANSKLEDLNIELQDVRTYLLTASGDVMSGTCGRRNSMYRLYIYRSLFHTYV